MKRMITLIVAASIAALALTACSGDGNDDAMEQSPITDVARQAGNFTTLLTALEAAGLEDTLSGTGPFTVFAPTDAAFAKLPAGTVETLLKPENVGQLADILTYHVVPDNLGATEVLASTELSTAFGQKISIDAGSVMVGNAITMANVTQTDIPAGNGVIHVIDEVLLPMDIVDLADSAGIFSTLLAAADAAGLVDALRADGPLTVFAPTDDAFEALPDGTVASLLMPENIDQLADILTYHVAPGEYASTALAGMDSLIMLNGDSAMIAIDGTGAMIDGANIVTTDLVATNGLVHVIDAVILPGSM